MVAPLSRVGVVGFLEHCSRKIGDAYFRTPRNVIIAFVNLLSVLEQNPGTSWQDLIGRVKIDAEGMRSAPSKQFLESSRAMPAVVADDELASFRL